MKASELERSFAAGEVIVDTGVKRRELFVVRSGEVRLEWKGSRAATALSAGGVFGEVGAILGTESPYRATAYDDVVVLALDVATLQRLCVECDEFSLRLIRHLAAEFVSATQREATSAGEAERVGIGTAELARVAHALLERQAGPEPPHPVPGMLRDLAKWSGLSILQAYRATQQLLDQGYLGLVDDQLSVLDPERLASLRG